MLSLPEQFYEDVDSGKNTPATIYFPENAPLNTRVFGELVADGVSLLRTAEAGVYATYDTAQIYQAEISRDQIGDVISELYIYEAFDRTSVFQKNVYSSLGKADIHQYYFSAAVLLLFLMMGVNYGYLYQKQSRAVEEKSEFTVSAKEKCIDQSASYDRSAVACGSFGVCCGLSGIREVSSCLFCGLTGRCCLEHCFLQR